MLRYCWEFDIDTKYNQYKYLNKMFDITELSHGLLHQYELYV